MAPRGVFKPRDVELPTPGAVRETLRGLIKRFTQRLAYRGAQAKGHVWNLSNWTCFIATAWMVINLSAGSRKGEGDVDHDDWFGEQRYPTA